MPDSSAEPLFNATLVYNDAAHTYTLNGSRCKSVTAVAKIPVDSYNIELWQKRMVAIGMTVDPDLIEQVAAAIDNKDIVNRVCEDAANTAKAHLKANRGSQMHRATEFVDLGQDDRLLTDQQKRDAQAWRRTLDAYGIEPLPGFVEGFVCWPEQKVAGRFDRVATIAAEDGVTAILDLKSGENAVLYPQSTCVQEALYAFAPHVSKTVVTVGDRSTVTEWQTMPEDINLETGYVIFLPPDADVGELWQVDLVHGIAGARHALTLVDWRKAFNYGKGLSSKIAAPAGMAGPSTAGGVGAVSSPAPPADPIADTVASAHGESVGRSSFPHREPTPQLPHTPLDEGAPVDDATFEPLEQTFLTLLDKERLWVQDVITQASQAGVPFTANKSIGKRTVRRFELYRGLITLAAAGLGGGDDELIRGLVATVLDSDAPYFPIFTVGHCVGALDCTLMAAERFAGLCDKAANRPELLELRSRPVAV